MYGVPRPLRTPYGVPRTRSVSPKPDDLSWAERCMRLVLSPDDRYSSVISTANQARA